MGTNYIAPIWRMPRNANNAPVDKLSNYSIDFGAGEYINCGNISSLQNTNILSISMWFNLNTLTTQRMLGHYTTNNGLTIESDSSVIYFVIANGSLTYATLPISGNITTNTWFNIVMVYDGSQSSNATRLKAYLNNEEKSLSYVGTIPSSLAVNNSAVFGLGSTIPGNPTYAGMDGQLSQVTVFDYALTDGTGGTTNQIEYLYNLNNPMAITGAEPVAYWPLGDNSNPNAPGSFPNISVGADSVFEFDVSGNRIDLGLESELEIGGASKYSTSIWFKKADNGSRCIWGYNYGDANGSGFYFWFNSGALRIAVGNNSLSNNFAFYQIEAVNLPIDEWQHALVVFDGTLTGSARIKVYHNGAAAVGAHTRSENLPSTLPDNNGNSNRNVYLGQLQLGNGGFSYNYNGRLSNVQQWTTDLSLSDAETLYNNGQPLMTGTQPQEANLKAWYKLNQYDSYWDLGGNGKWTFNNAALN